ncbi:hypothetical protein SEA_BANQUO_6 [Gordonia phage Banquo]|nr:hypothetical protein SEA_BANQUO_6 [Gordonia phage Banquo]
MANAFVETVKATYADLKAIQDANVEAWAVGYEADEALYYSEVEPRVTYKDVLIAVAREWRARKAEARAEAEYWEAREREHFAPLADPAVAEADPATAVFRTRNGARMAALLAARAVARGVQLVAVVRAGLTVLRYGGKVMGMTTTKLTVTKYEDAEGDGRCQQCGREGLRWLAVLSDGSRCGVECAKAVVGFKPAPKAYRWIAGCEVVAEWCECGATFVLYRDGAVGRLAMNGSLMTVAGFDAVRRQAVERHGLAA